jgi:hypothetical protein
MKPYFKELDADKVRKVFEEYKSKHNEYPTTNAIKKLCASKENRGVIPSIKWIQRKGGIIPFYQLLGLHYTDARTGARRGAIATSANKKSQSLDVKLSKQFIEKFGESNVHWQSPYNSRGISLHRSDFKIYRKDGSYFFVDLFFPQDMDSLQGCVNSKIKKLSIASVEKGVKVYFICCNGEDTSPYTLDYYVRHRKTPMPDNVHLIHISEVSKWIV